MSVPFDPGRLGQYREEAAKRLHQIAQSVLEDPDRREWFVMAAGDAWITSAEGVGQSVERWKEGMSDQDRQHFVGQMAQAFFSWVLLESMTKAIENPRDEDWRELVWRMLEERPRLFELGDPPSTDRR